MESQFTKCGAMFYFVNELGPTAKQGVEISPIEICPRTDNSAKFQLVIFDDSAHSMILEEKKYLRTLIGDVLKGSQDNHLIRP